MDRRVQEVLRLVESHDLYLRLPNPLDDLAKAVSLSASRLRHIFKAETGLTLAEFLVALKLDRAKKLLETSHLSVKEVAADVGMRNESHFVRIFNRAYRVTPGYYRFHVVAAKLGDKNGDTPPASHSRISQKVATAERI